MSQLLLRPVPNALRFQHMASLVAILFAAGLRGFSADLEEARLEFRAGNYSVCIAQAEKATAEKSYSEQWPLLWTEALWTIGHYEAALTAVTNALQNHRNSLPLRWMARTVFLSNGLTNQANAMVAQILEISSTRPWAFRQASDLVTFGQAALLRGADPKQVLDKLFNRAKKDDPTLRSAYLASGNLALDKHDYALAAKTFQEGLKQLPDDPDMHFGLAQAYAPSETTLMMTSLEAALNCNSNHIPSLLLLADHRITAEEYGDAEKLLDQVRAINPWHPEAWAYSAILAHLRSQSARESVAREMALKYWPSNPRVPYLIGLKLSQKYRFAEGAEQQRQALKFDANFLPAKAQLAQDLLRLGHETEGWRLASEVHQDDGYDVTAVNLVTLHDTVAKFQTLSNENFIVRMQAHEAALYGNRVLQLLEAARKKLTHKYRLELTRPVLLEVFPDQKDFAVRTFGMPENHGFLGVCFGHVITANSPAARPNSRFNWESMLWHEFCHVITLQLTRNKMPRWLSEGISVYEERQANPAWGEQMGPRYREMILGEELTPVAKLSSAFLAPRSEAHLQFAYYQSSLVVEFLVDRFGQDQLVAILRDLGQGMDINQAIERHTAAMTQIEKDFEAFALNLANQLAPGLDWEKPSLETLLPRVAIAHSTQSSAPNFWRMTQESQQLMKDEQWTEAKTILQQLVSLYPDFKGPESAYLMLAQVHQALGETNAEQQMLTQFAEMDDEATDAYLRLMELAAEAQDWAVVTTNAHRYLAVNPLVAPPYRYLAQASEAREQTESAIRAYRALLQLDPPNPAEVNFLLARQLHRSGDPTARRHVLQALEDAPRYRAALRLLLEINRSDPAPPMQTTSLQTAGPVLERGATLPAQHQLDSPFQANKDVRAVEAKP